MAEKVKKKVVVFHLTYTSKNEARTFSELLDCFMDLDESKRRVADKDGNIYIISVQLVEEGIYSIFLQSLADKDLPKIANEDNDGDEENIDLPKGKKLSYKNIFVYKKDKSILGMAKLQHHPQNAKLKFCIMQVIKNNVPEFEGFSYTLAQIADKNVKEFIKNAKTISMAQFTSSDFTEANNISESNLKKYESFLSGEGIRKTTKISGIRKADIREKIGFLIEDILSNNEVLSEFDISMEVDGNRVNINKFYKQHEIYVLKDENNKYYFNYDDLYEKVVGIVRDYK